MEDHTKPADEKISAPLSSRLSPNQQALAAPGQTLQVPVECIPVVTAIDPPQSTVLRDITIFGQKFQPTANTCGPLDIPPIVTFLDSHPSGPIVAAVKSFNDTQIVARVPNGAKTSIVTVTNTKGIASPVPAAFTVLPTIDSFSPLRGGVGSAVQLNGSALYNTPQFFFLDKDGREIPAAFSNPTLTSILVAVPAGAVTGPIKVVTKGGGTARTMGNFVVTVAAPQVGDHMPKFGAPGTKISIFAKPGTKFESIQSVRFLTDPDAIGRARRIVLNKGEFTVSGDMTRIDALVPLGAVSGKIRVTNESGASSTGVFRVPLAAPGVLAARSLAGPRIELTWRDATTTEAGFWLERTIGENDSGYVPIAMLAPNTVSHVDTNVSAGTTYRYRLFAFNSIEGDSAASNAAILTVNGSVLANPLRLLFSAVRDGANPAAQTLSIIRSGNAGGEQMWSVSDDAPWLSVSPASGTTPGMASVAIDLFGLKAGLYTGLITVRSTGPTPAVDTVPVELTVKAPAGAITIVIDDGVAVMA